MAGRVQWRRFAFFDKDTVNENIEITLGSIPTCATADGGILLFGNDKGNITLTDRNFNIIWVNKVFNGPVRGISYIYDIMNHKKQYIVTIGEELRNNNQSTPTSTSISTTNTTSLSTTSSITTGFQGENKTHDPYYIKVFSTNDMSHPIQAFLATNPTIQDNSTLTSFAVTSNGYQIAVGFSSGVILLFSGNFLAEGSVGRQYVPQLLLHGHKSVVTGLYFCELNFIPAKSSTNDRNVRLYAVFGGPAIGGNASTQQPHPDPEIADAGILAFDTSFSTFGGGSGVPINRVPPRVLDFFGATPQCSSLMKQTYELIVGREEGVFSYSIEDRGGAAGFEGEKQCITAVGRYILVACLDDKSKRTVITIYDLRNKFISMSAMLPLGDTVRMVLSDGGVAYVVTSSWTLIRFREKDTASKLDVLLRKSLYPLAISLAAEEQSDVSEVMRLYKTYADHLYKKNDFDGAVVQYCHTIGFIAPSYVIRRFLDTQRIDNLTVYLEKLHQKGLATKDHTTLLLTCYTKTNNTTKLSEFCLIKNDETLNKDQLNDINKLKSTITTTNNNNNNNNNLSYSNDNKLGTQSNTTISMNFDVLTAIYTLHDAGFDEHALRLALLNEKHEEYIHISLISKTKKDVDRALSYFLTCITIGDMQLNSITEIIYKFGTLFLNERPISFTSLLIQLCTGTLDRKKLRELLLNESKEENLQSFEIESELEVILTKHYKHTLSHPKTKQKGSVFILSEFFPVEDALVVFTDDEKYLRIFIEGVSEGMRLSNMTMPSRLTELLLELYLVEYQSIRDILHSNETNNNKLDLLNKIKSLEDKILAILDGASSVNSEYDLSNALLLMHSFGFENGEMFLFEKMQSTDLILRRCIETGNERGIMRVLKREGRKDPELFIQVLTYFVRLSITSNNNNNNHNNNLKKSLKHSNNKDSDDENDFDSDDDDEVHNRHKYNGNGNDDDDDDDERWDLISEVLTLVEKESILTPMQIIPILSENPNLPLHIASRFIQKTLQETSDELITLEREVTHMKRIVQGVVQENIAAKQHKLNQQINKKDNNQKDDYNIYNNNSNNVNKNNNNNNNNNDDDDDEFEVQQAEAEREIEKQKWLNIKKAQQERTGGHESFYGELEHSSDGFATIAAYFGKTIIS